MRLPVRVVPVAVVIVAWALSFLGPLSDLLLVLIPAAALGFAASGRRWAVAIVLLGAPTTPPMVAAVTDYARGAVALRGAGLYDHETWTNPDRRYRCFRTSSGCLVDGSEWVRHDPYNLVAVALLDWLGPMPGAYLGAYPTRDEALGHLARGFPIDGDRLLADEVRLPTGETVRLPSGFGAAVLQGTRFLPHVSWPPDDPEGERAYFLHLEEREGPLAGAIVGTCLVLRIPRFLLNSPHILLVDLETARPFAAYDDGYLEWRRFHRDERRRR